MAPANSPRLSAFVPALSEYANAFSGELDDFVMGEAEISADDDLRPRDGFIPFADQYMAADILITLNEESMRTLAYWTPQYAARFENEARLAFYCDLAGFVEEMPDDDLEWKNKAANILSEAMDEARDNTSAGQITASSLSDAVDRIWGEMPEKQRERFSEYELDDPDMARIRIGCSFSASEKEPFYAFVSVNFDAPYFRSNAQIARDSGKAGREMDLLLAESSGNAPETETDFRNSVRLLLDHAFPEADIEQILADSETPSPGA